MEKRAVETDNGRRRKKMSSFYVIDADVKFASEETAKKVEERLKALEQGEHMWELDRNGSTLGVSYYDYGSWDLDDAITEVFADAKASGTLFIYEETDDLKRQIIFDNGTMEEHPEIRGIYTVEDALNVFGDQLMLNPAVIKTQEKPNTRIDYLYRDADNYKMPNSAVVKGLLSEDQKKIIMSSLQDGEFFIPSQVGLPETRVDEYWDMESDHVFFELDEDSFTATDEEPTVSVTAEGLVKRFEAVLEDGWNVTEAERNAMNHYEVKGYSSLDEKVNAAENKKSVNQHPVNTIKKDEKMI